MHSGMERSLALLAALSGPGRRAQPVGKAVGMLAWIGEAMAQVLRKVGERARPAGWAPPCLLRGAAQNGARAGGLWCW